MDYRFDYGIGSGATDGNMVVLEGVTNYSITRTVSPANHRQHGSTRAWDPRYEIRVAPACSERPKATAGRAGAFFRATLCMFEKLDLGTFFGFRTWIACIELFVLFVPLQQDFFVCLRSFLRGAQPVAP